ncbi:MAG: NAD(P)H-dependent oxidoreductase [Lachnospiraceae bacterium]
MTKLFLLYPENLPEDHTERLDRILGQSLFSHPCQRISTADQLEQWLPSLKGNRILFAVHLGASGLNTVLYQMVCVLRMHPDCLDNCFGGVIVDGCQDLYTKETGREIVFTMNQAGCTFPGRPLIEATGSLSNFTIQANLQNTNTLTAYEDSVSDLIQRLLTFTYVKPKKPNLLCIHASNNKSSNTYGLWEAIREKLPEIEIAEFNARNGEITDCSGCPFKMCMHYSEKGSCFYGGTMVEEAYPAVEKCDGMILLCPNYNDALSANLTAFINRLTSLYRRISFSEKYLFSIVVSGYSGGDIVANQLISALNMNKRFILPGKFAMIETANDPGSIFLQEGIQGRIDAFAQHICHYLT